MSRVRILIVEDENIVALDLEQTLRRVGYDVVGIASSGPESVEKAIELRPDLILMDVQLRGGSDGIEAVEAVKEVFNPGIIFLTAYADERTLDRAKSVQPLAYLLKPFNDQDLYAAIEVALAKQRRDEAERRKNAEALLLSEERFRLLVDGVRDYALYLLDVNGNVATWNSGAERIHGYTADEVIGRHASLFFPEDDRQAASEALRQAAAHGRYHTEGWRVRKDGTRFWAEVDLTALYHEDGRLRAFAKIEHDITDRKELEDLRAELLAKEKAARTEAERLNTIKDEFLKTLSHELRTPLTPIIGWTLFLRSAQYNEETSKRALEIIERNARAQVSLVDDLLDVNKIVTGELCLEFHFCPLARSLESAIENVRTTAEAKGVQLCYAKKTTDATVMGDRARLEQVFRNLLTNAVKFTPSGGRVEVLLSQTDVHALIQVQDTGEGIAPEFLPHIFTRFSQADSSTSRRYSGLGLGLSIVKHLVELHGGRVHAQSAGRNMGALFTVQLPLAAIDRLPRFGT
jgi:PAS domain S-box-containing protein